MKTTGLIAAFGLFGLFLQIASAALIPFAIEYETKQGESIYLQGDHPLLGELDIEKALKLSPHQYPVWSIKLDLSDASRKSTLRYRYILRQDNPELISQRKNIQVLTPWMSLPLVNHSSKTSHSLRDLEYRLETILGIRSQFLKHERPLYLYSPILVPKQAPVCLLYMHDGQNLFGSGPMNWEMSQVIAKLPLQKCFWIIIGVGHSQARLQEYLPPYSSGPLGSGAGDLYARFIFEELMPMVENRIAHKYPIKARVMAGASMGGLISLYLGQIGQEHAYPFPLTAVLALSPSLQFSEITERLNSLKSKIYLDSGTSGPGFDHYYETYSLRDKLLEYGKIYGRDIWHVTGSNHLHQEQFWRQRLGAALMWSTSR